MIVLETLNALSNINKTENHGRFHFEKDTSQNFSVIGGYHTVKEELLQMKDILQQYEKYKRYNIRTPKGLLLEGPPGNGKTLLAKCFAGECRFHFLAVSGAEFNEKYVGIGAARVREMFRLAAENQPCIIFVDELDAIGGKRQSDGEGSMTERSQTLNQLLVLMDGFSSDAMKQVFVVAATNRKDILDEALLRSGRFDKIVHIPNPDKFARKEIIDIHRHQKPILESVTTDEIVQITEGLSGADIENVLNEASLAALRKNKSVSCMEEIEDVRDRLKLGFTVQRKYLPNDISKRVAVHESGHLLMSIMCQHHEYPEKITIESTGKNTLGFTSYHTSPDMEIGLYSKQYLKEKIMTLLAGRISEEILCRDGISTGSVNDMAHVTNIARNMIVDYKMNRNPIYSVLSDNNKQRIDYQIQKLVEECYIETKLLLTRNQELLFWFSRQLLMQRTMSCKEIGVNVKKGLLLYPSKDIISYRIF
jgi:cell division protease FtsH